MQSRQSMVVQTNKKRGSQCTADISPVTFKELWDNFADERTPPYNVNGKAPKGFENQCAIRLSVTLHRVGVKMISFSQKNVKPERGKATIGRILLNGLATATRANEMAQWLNQRPICGVAADKDITGEGWEDKIKGKTGIIFFGDYWTRGSEDSANATGGHIDLWNKNKITGTGSYFRIQFGIVIPNIWSDFDKSKRIVFFEVN